MGDTVFKLWKERRLRIANQHQNGRKSDKQEAWCNVIFKHSILCEFENNNQVFPSFKNSWTDSLIKFS